MVRLLESLCLLLALLAAGVIAAAPADAGTRVYLIRGLLDVSTGLDDLGAKLKRRGIPSLVTGYARSSHVRGFATA